MTKIFAYPLSTVGGLIIAPDGTILLTKSNKWNNLYSVPGGKIEMGESREQAFVREVLEETGLKIVNVHFALVQDSVYSPDFYEEQHFVMHDYIAELAPECSKDDVILNEEAYDFVWVEPEVAKTMTVHKEVLVLLDWYIDYKAKINVGIIGFENHKIACIIGCIPSERNREQEVLIDLKVTAKIGNGVKNDDINKTVSYVDLANTCTEMAQKNQYRLIETMGSEILDKLLEKFPIESAWIKVKKPGAIPTALWPIVELEKKRNFKRYS